MLSLSLGKIAVTSTALVAVGLYFHNTAEVKQVAPDLLPSNNIGYSVEHPTFTLSYSEDHEQAEWIAYELNEQYLEKNTKRTNNFRPDPSVKTGSAELIDYKKSGYDRGHLCPSADRSNSREANASTFFLSNISPQTPSFNRGIWKKLEEKTRWYVHQHKSLYIITGPVLSDSLPEIGVNHVDVPSAYYKIILDKTEQPYKACAFLMKNEGSTLPLDSFVVSIDSVESVTGIDFFEKLPKKLEKKIESSSQILW